MDAGERFDALIKKDFGGNLYRAARAWGIPQATLHRYVHGQRSKGRQPPAPRVNHLRLLADYYQTTIEWFLGGLGRNPLLDAAPMPVQKDWAGVLAEIGLTGEAYEIYRELPTSLASAAHAICHWGLHKEGLTALPTEELSLALTGNTLAHRYELQGWIELFRGWLGSFGAERVREKLTSELDRARLGFQPLACLMLEKGQISREDVRATYSWFRPSLTLPPHVMRTAVNIEYPELPPLIAQPVKRKAPSRKSKRSKSP